MQSAVLFNVRVVCVIIIHAEWQAGRVQGVPCELRAVAAAATSGLDGG